MATAKRNEKQKAIGQASYKRAQDRKAENVLLQEDARKANDVFRKAGQPTPYQSRKTAEYQERIVRKYGTQDSE